MMNESQVRNLLNDVRARIAEYKQAGGSDTVYLDGKEQAILEILGETASQTMPNDSNAATPAEIHAKTYNDPIAKAMVDAYYVETETSEISPNGLVFAVAVSTMIGIDPEDDPEAVISDLRWIGRMTERAADDLTEKLIP